MLLPTGLSERFVTPYFGRVTELLEDLCFSWRIMLTLGWVNSGLGRRVLEPRKDYCQNLGLIDIAIRNIREEVEVDGAQQGGSSSPPISS